MGWMNESAVRLEEQIISLFYLLFLPDRILPDGTDLEEVLQFGVENGITQIWADIPGRKNCRNNISGQAFLKPIFTAAIKRRRNPLKTGGEILQKTGGFKKWIYRMKNVSW